MGKPRLLLRKRPWTCWYSQGCPRHRARIQLTKRDRAVHPDQNLFSWVRVWCFLAYNLGFASTHEMPTRLHQGQCWSIKQHALVSTHIHVLALPNSPLSISTTYYLGHLLSQAIKNAADYVHSYLTSQDHDKRAAPSVFFLIRFFAIHASTFFCHWEVKKGVYLFFEEKSLKTWSAAWTPAVKVWRKIIIFLRQVRN